MQQKSEQNMNEMTEFQHWIPNTEFIALLIRCKRCEMLWLRNSWKLSWWNAWKRMRTKKNTTEKFHRFLVQFSETSRFNPLVWQVLGKQWTAAAESAAIIIQNIKHHKSAQMKDTSYSFFCWPIFFAAILGVSRYVYSFLFCSCVWGVLSPCWNTR